MRQIEGSRAGSQLLVTRLARLRTKLEVNSAVLKLHLDAVREVSAAMADAMRNAELRRHLLASDPGCARASMIKIILAGLWACLVTLAPATPRCLGRPATPQQRWQSPRSCSADWRPSGPE